VSCSLSNSISVITIEVFLLDFVVNGICDAFNLLHRVVHFVLRIVELCRELILNHLNHLTELILHVSCAEAALLHLLTCPVSLPNLTDLDVEVLNHAVEVLELLVHTLLKSPHGESILPGAPSQTSNLQVEHLLELDVALLVGFGEHGEFALPPSIGDLLVKRLNDEDEVVLLNPPEHIAILSDDLQGLSHACKLLLLEDLLVGLLHDGDEHVEEHNLDDGSPDHEETHA